jgi:ATP-dependent RNA helicase DDX47/RRP3
MDEADRLLNLEFEEAINALVSLLPTERTTMLFSATMTSKVGKLERAHLRHPTKVQVSLNVRFCMCNPKACA